MAMPARMASTDPLLNNQEMVTHISASGTAVRKNSEIARTLSAVLYGASLVDQFCVFMLGNGACALV